MKANKTDDSVLWTDSMLSTRIETFGYQMAEMGRQQAFSQTAQNNGDYDGMRMYNDRAEMYRVSANELKKDINAQIALRRTNKLIVA